MNNPNNKKEQTKAAQAGSLFKTIRMFALIAVMAVTSAALTACNNGSTELTDWAYIQDKGTLVMGIDPSFPPMGYEDNGEYVGFDIDTANEVAKILGVTLEVKAIDWGMKEQELAAKKIDIVWNGFTMTEARIQALNFSVPYLRNNQVVAVKTSSAVQKLDDLAGKKLGYQFGSSALDAINSNDKLKDLTKEGLESNVELLNLKLAGDLVDAVVMDEVVANFLNKEGAFRILGEKLSYEQYGVGMRKGDNLLQFKINSALKTLSADGDGSDSTLETIAKKWFNGDTSGLLV